MDLGLYHNSHEFYCRSVFGAVPSGSQVVLRLRADKNIEENWQASVRLWQSNAGETIVPMTWEGEAFKATLTMPDKGCLLWYYFIVSYDGKTVYYGNNHEQLGGKGRITAQEPPSYQITVYDKAVKTPDWFKNAIVYQIFPDRFRRGKDTTAVLTGKKGAVIHSDWDDIPAYWKNPDTGEIAFYDFYGGNLAGIREKFSYLKELGITAVYLNPIFESCTNHRYSTADYHRVDPFLGTNEEFAAFCRAAKEEGLAVILDGVFSHTGADSIYFNRFGHYDSVGAYQSKESPYYSWYRFKEYPNDYESWWGVMDLPNVEETEPSYMDFIIHNDDSVLRYWMRQGISGWRLDVVDELPAAFLRDFYKTLKEENPDAVLIGEVWEDASNKISYGEQREYLCGYELDSAMNYALRTIAVDFIMGRKEGRRMLAEMTHLIENYPPEHFYAMLNLIGSHDIERILTVLAKDADTNTLSAEDIAKKRLHLLLAWQMTMPGAPCIYYGDEAGVTGGKDPDNRRTYPWGHEDEEILSWTKELTGLRRRSDALRTGRFIPLYADGDVFAYARSIEGGRDIFGQKKEDGFFIIVMNKNTTSLRTVSVYTNGLAYGELTNALYPRMKPIRTINSRFTLTLPPLSAVILKGQEARKKRAGVLLHPTSLPSAGGNGDLGPNAYRFIDFLKTAGQSLWQILPLTPPLMGDSPYLARSAFAGNERLISLDVLHEWGWLSAEELCEYKEAVAKTKSWDEAWKVKKDALWRMSHKKDLNVPWSPYADFCKENAYWLDDYALFRSVSDFFGGKVWTEWPDNIRCHAADGVAYYKKELSGAISHYKFLQYIFYCQWQSLRKYAHDNGVQILGDMPMFVAHNSADCWAHQELFQLDEAGNPTAVAGVPPDYFSVDGQLWGNPLYDYEAMAADGYRWWVERFRAIYQFVDEVRIDHFRGLESYWAVPAEAKTAREGAWVKGPGLDLFRAVYKELGFLPMVAEDLGIITDDVCALKDALRLPGMKILHFHMAERGDGRYSFDTEPNCLVYTGTHDNNTTLGWYEDDLDESGRLQLRQALGLPDDAAPEAVVRAVIAYVYSRRAETAVVPLQDILALPGNCRMNVPGTAEGNWQWQMDGGMLKLDIAKWLSELCKEYGR
ncbi:4-alpha-glucanotransferase [Megasphaera stantonii]|uniref:4-alpha-glucanotransferase n=1 Tax=Megasphaera stantonii TaxID=2144175 RepID=UPI00320AAF1F